MRRLLFVSCVMFLLPQISSAQLKMELGVKGGLNLCGLGLSSDGKLNGAKYNSLTSFHGGVYGSIRLSKLGIQPEIVFSKQGQTFNTPNYNGLRTELSYINIPVMIKYYPFGGVSLQVGPQLGLLMSAKGDLVQIFSSGGLNGGLGPATLNQDLKSYLNTTDFSIAFGAGVDLPLGINLAFRYNYGVTNINKYAGGTTESPSFSVAKTQNQVIQFSLGKKLYKIGK